MTETEFKRALDAIFDGPPYTMIELTVLLGQHGGTILRALLMADAVATENLHLCEKLVGGGEYEGATCYEYGDDNRAAVSEIIKVAAKLATLEYCVSEYQTDWAVKVPASVLSQIKKQNERMVSLAIRLKNAADTLRPKPPEPEKHKCTGRYDCECLETEQQKTAEVGRGRT